MTIGNQTGPHVPSESRPTQFSRITREEAYMAIAAVMAKRSTCLRGNVGCVAVVNNHIVCAGYNGAPPGMPECLEVGCGGGVVGGGLTEIFPNGCTRSVHAELNMVAYAARHGIPLDGCTVYTTHAPCVPCAKALISAGTVKLVYETPYRVPEGLELIDSANVQILRWGN